MKRLVTPAGFNASAKTVDLSNVSGFALPGLLAVCNATHGVLLYNPMQAGCGAASIAAGVVHLQFDTAAAGHANGDTLFAIYDDGAEGALDSSLQAILANQVAIAGNAGTSPPVLASGATGLFGWFRKIVDLLTGALTVVQQPFRPIAGATIVLTVGPTATPAGTLALPATAASSYRVRNPASSLSPVTWILTADNTKTPTIPTASSTSGTGGAAGDKTIDPGGVEVFTLSSAQQAALAAGTLYLSALTPTGGSATLAITPGFGG